MTPFRFVDQAGREVPVTVTQDGGEPGWVRPGRRTRFKIRPNTIALRVEQIAIDNAKDWLVNDFRVGGRSQFHGVYGGTPGRSVSNDASPELDGFDAEVLCELGPGVRPERAFDTAQTAMDLIFDVVYRGQNPEGQPLSCTIRCTAH